MRRKQGEGLTAVERAALFEDRQRAAGRRRFQMWVDSDLLDSWERQAGELPADLDRISRINAVLRRWRDRAEQSTANVAQRSPVSATAPVEPTSTAVDMLAPAPAAPGRRAPRPPIPPGVVQRMVSLRNQGLTFQQIGQRLADEGILNSKGKPYDARTVMRTIDRELNRRAAG